MSEPVFDVTACLEGIERGDERAAGDLVGHCYPLVMKIVRAHLPRTLSDQDLAQEVFLKMFSRLDRYERRADVPFEHWLSRLAVRTCIDRLRAESREPFIRAESLSEAAEGWLETLTGDAPPPVDEVLAARELVDALLALLPARDRLLLKLLDVEGLSVAEVSRLTGWGASLVKVRAFRARRRLRKAAEEWGMAEKGTRR